MNQQMNHSFLPTFPEKTLSLQKKSKILMNVRNFYQLVFNMRNLKLLPFVLLLISLASFGQTIRTINVETAGTLPTLISDEEKYTIVSLTLTGNLNGTDFRLLREMAGCGYDGRETQGS